MKALSVRQPWAWLLFHGKTIENRDWYTAYRGPLVILASKGMTQDEYEDARDFVRSFNSGLACQIPHQESLVYGAAIGVVEQVGCVKQHSSPWFQGQWGHVYANPRELVVPILTSGRLGIFEWEPPEPLKFADQAEGERGAMEACRDFGLLNFD